MIKIDNIIGIAKYKGNPKDFYKEFWNITPFTKGKLYAIYEYDGQKLLKGDNKEELKFISSAFNKIKT